MKEKVTIGQKETRNKNLKSIKKQANGITLIALVITIIVLLILAGVTIATLTGENGILTRAQDAKTQTGVEGEKEEIQLAYAGAVAEKRGTGDVTADDLNREFGTNGTNATAEDNGDGTITVTFESGRKYEVDSNGNIEGPTTGVVAEEFSRENGNIDIVFLREKTDNVSTSANVPVLGTNMAPVNFNIETNKFEEVSEEDWEYSYTNAPKQSHWANAVVKDEEGNVTGYFVWIPRYAYKITYYDSSFETVIGYSDARGIVTTNGEEYIGKGSRRKAGDNYVVHPAFTNDINVGGWDNELEGIWVAKYEASSSNPLESYGGGNTTDLDVRILPGVTSWRRNTITNIYVVSRDYCTENNSHLMKNSEWGAVAYLSYSNYGIGRDTNIINTNTEESFYTGGSNIESEIYTTNIGQSSTGNEYGIYDMNGNAYEYVASYVNNGYSQLTNYGETLIEAGKSSESSEKRTVQVYEASNGGDNNISDIQEENYRINSERMFGDAIYEISTTAYAADGSWQTSYSVFPYMDTPFFIRSGTYGNQYAGIFCFYRYNGDWSGVNSFRLALAF